MRLVTTGSTDQSIRVWAYDSSGAAITGEAYNSAGIAVSVVVRSAGRIVSTTALTLVARSSAGVHTDSAFTEVGAGEYVVDLPDSYCATADRQVSVTLTSDAISGGYVLSETISTLLQHVVLGNVPHGGASATLSLGPVTITAGDGTPNIKLTGSGNADGIAWTRSGSGDPLDSDIVDQIQSGLAQTGADGDTLETLSDQIDGIATPSDVTTALEDMDLDKALIAQGAERAVNVDVNHRVHSHVYDMQANTITASALAADAGAEIAALVWSAATRSLTDKAGFALSATGLDLVTAWTTDITGSLSGNVGGIAGTIQTLDQLDTAQDTQHGTTRTAVDDAFTVIKGATWSGTTDTLEAIRDRGDVAWITGAGGVGSGTGARTITVTIDDGTDPLENAIVRMTEGVNTYTALSDVTGVATFNLDDATYVVAITKSGYSYAGTTLLVNGTESETYSMTQVTPTIPDDPALCTVTIPVVNQYGAALVGEIVEIRFNQFTDAATATAVVLSPPPTLTSDANGNVIVELLRDADYSVFYGQDDYIRRLDFSVPDADSYAVGE